MPGIKTSKHGAHRMRATCNSKTIIVPKNSAGNPETHHRDAALRLAAEMGWQGVWVASSIPGFKGLVWVNSTNPLETRTFEVTPETADGL